MNQIAGNWLLLEMLSFFWSFRVLDALTNVAVPLFVKACFVCVQWWRVEESRCHEEDSPEDELKAHQGVGVGIRLAVELLVKVVQLLVLQQIGQNHVKLMLIYFNLKKCFFFQKAVNLSWSEIAMSEIIAYPVRNVEADFREGLEAAWVSHNLGFEERLRLFEHLRTLFADGGWVVFTGQMLLLPPFHKAKLDIHVHLKYSVFRNRIRVQLALTKANQL